MPNRRDFMKGVAGAAAGLWMIDKRLLAKASAQGPGQGRGQGQTEASEAPVARREVRVGGKRVKVIDVHAHATVPGVGDVVKGTPLERYAQGGRPLGPDRLRELDKRGIDLQVLDINTFWWYGAADRGPVWHPCGRRHRRASRSCQRLAHRLSRRTAVHRHARDVRCFARRGFERSRGASSAEASPQRRTSPVSRSNRSRTRPTV